MTQNHRIIIGIAIIAFVTAAAVFAERSESISRFFSFLPENASSSFQAANFVPVVHAPPAAARRSAARGKSASPAKKQTSAGTLPGGSSSNPSAVGILIGSTSTAAVGSAGIQIGADGTGAASGSGITGSQDIPPYNNVSGASQSGASPAVLWNPRTARVLISEVLPGLKGDTDYEFIELYNPTGEAVDLTGWTIKKKSSGGSESILVAASHFSGRRILPGKHFLLANGRGYSGAVAADAAWPPSYTLAQSKNSITLYDKRKEAVDSAAWDKIPEGKSLTRISRDGGDFAVEDPTPQNSSG